MATKLDPEFEAEIRELLSLKNLLPDPPPPPPKPHLALASESELSVDTLRERFERASERLMLAEKRCIKEWLNEARSREALRQEREQLAWQQRIDAWVEDRRQMQEHERRMERYLDPTNSGIYGAAPCHRNRGDK
jgi:hypothetical protein